jgi:COP9 signalosome complex subunit 4
VLSGALLNSSGVQLTTAQRAANWLKVAQAYLKADNAASCESSLKATNEHLRALPPGAEPGLRVQYGVAVAQNTDFMKNFLQAAMRYNEAALQAAGFGFPPAEVTQLFESATRCVLLAEPGPQRRRVMNHIASEGLIGGVAVRGPFAAVRAHFAPPTLHPRSPPPPLEMQPLYLTMLDKMKRERLISTGDAAKFEMLLPQHCRALNSEGLSLFADCVMKHNVIAASRVYSSVSFEALGALLGIPGDAARRLVARLVMEKRLSARLDQVAGFVDFAPPTVSQETATLLNMNAAIADACGALNDLVRDTAGI